MLCEVLILLDILTRDKSLFLREEKPKREFRFFCFTKASKARFRKQAENKKTQAPTGGWFFFVGLPF